MSKKKNPLLVKLGAKVKLKRFMLGLTQLELSEKCNIHVNYIGSIERGERNPSLTSLSNLAKGLKCSIAELIE